MRFEIPENKKQVHEMRFTVAWGEMDAMGHVNNAMYFRYLENARINWMRAAGLPSGRESGTGPVVANAFCSFYRQLEYPDAVLLKLYVGQPARTTFESWGTMERVREPGVLCAAGGATVIWCDYARQKAIDLPPWVRALVA